MRLAEHVAVCDNGKELVYVVISATGSVRQVIATRVDADI